MRRPALVLSLLSLALAPVSARAFVGPALDGAVAPSPEPASVVVFRVGRDTIVTFRPPRGARAGAPLLLPVPGSIGVDDVRTLRGDALDRVETLTEPRLVELWERDPCERASPGSPGQRGGEARPTAEARLDRDGYAITVMRPRSAAGLVGWLRGHGYPTPPRLEAAARAYVQRGYAFVVARPRPGVVGQPPLRLHVRSDRLVLPLALADRASDPLVVHVIAPERYRAVDRANVLVPTDLALHPRARERFDEVYATILDRVLARHPGAAVTEYAAPLGTCVACPTEPLTDADVDALGGDVLGPARPALDRLVLTRLRVPVGADVELAPAPPLRPARSAAQAARRPPRRAQAYAARFAIQHTWDAPRQCAAPARPRWGAALGRGRPPVRVAAPTREIIETGHLRRYLLTWTPVLRIPSRGDAAPAD